MPLLEKSIVIPNCTPEEVLEFCLDGANFAAIFPEPIRPVGKVDPADLRIEAGREFQFRHWMFGCIPAKWRVRIVEVQAHQYFIDEMLQGPMKTFRHEHRVTAAAGGTLYTDRVEYCAIGGAIAEKLFVDWYLRRIFAARHRNMLRLLKKPGTVECKVRPLTTGEIAMARNVFKDSVDYAKVKVHKAPYIVGAGSNAMTPKGEMYFPEHYFKPDFSMERDRYKVLFMHEMTHVWQHQLGYRVLYHGVIIGIKGGYRTERGQQVGRAYRYDTVADAGKPMSAFNMEQQGELVSHYFAAAFLTFDPDKLEFLSVILESFLKNPKDAGLLPRTTRIKK